MRLFLPILAAFALTLASVPSTVEAGPVRTAAAGTATAGKAVARGTVTAGKGVARGTAKVAKGSGRLVCRVFTLGRRC